MKLGFVSQSQRLHVTTKNGRVQGRGVVKSELSAYLRLLAFPVAILFSLCNGASRKAVGRSGLELPDGQLMHILRYIFESHFVINGGNILALQRILAHSDLRVTMCGHTLFLNTW